MSALALAVTTTRLSTRPFVGLGVQADGVFYHEDCLNAFKLTEADLELFDRRMRQITPSITRTFVDVRWFNPSCEGRTFTWTTPEYGHLVRLLRLVDSLGGRQNLVCFQPTDIPAAQLPRLIDAMVGLIEHLRTAEGIASVGWVTLFNEPDSFVPHDSPLYQRVFGDRRRTANKSWSDYVAAGRYAVELLERRGLAPAVRLATPDCVWGHPMRLERLTLAARDFAGLEVAYAYHNYNPEWLEFYTGNPDYDYRGVRAESRLFRDIVGPERELVCWEFNGAGQHFGSTFPGVGRYGEEIVGSVQHGSDLTDKIFSALSEGIDGMCLWCVADGPYWPWCKEPTMEFGLYRWKTHGWAPKPYWYYYTALCNQLRPGRPRLRIEGLRDDAPVNALALGGEDRITAAVINKTGAAQLVDLRLPRPVLEATRLRVYLGAFPTPDGGPIDRVEPVRPGDSNTFRLDLQPHELTICNVSEGVHK